MKIISKEIALVLLAFAISFLYAWLRYVTFGPYHIEDLLYVLNKATAFSIILIIFIGYSPIRPSRLHREIIGKLSFFIALAHVIISLILLPTDYYKQYHLSGGKILPGFAFSLIFGILSILSFIAIYQYFKTREVRLVDYQYFAKLSIFFFLTLFLHIAFFGYHTWIHPAGWYGGFPPISLISILLLFVAMPLAVYFLRKKMQPEDEN